MISRLYGKLILKQPPTLLIDVGGVGYELEAPMSTFYEMPAPGELVTVLTHLIVREDAHVLFGFATPDERGLFRHLIKVNGVGPRMALTILSGISAADFAACVQSRDAVTLTRLPGIGKKTAERLVVEMQDKLGGMSAADGAPTPAAQPISDAVSALVALGYKQADAQRMARAVAADGMTSEHIIREALKTQVK